MSTQNVKCGKGNLEERIVYRGPNEKAMAVKSIVKKLFFEGADKYVRLKRSREDVPTSFEDEYFSDRNDEARVWIQYIEGVNCPDLIKIYPDSKHDIFRIFPPKDATNVRIDIEHEKTLFFYKNYRIMFKWKGYPQVILDGLNYIPRKRS